MRNALTMTGRRMTKALIWAATLWACLHGVVAQGAPLRYANIMWSSEPASPGHRTVHFTVETGWRASDFGSPMLGGTINLGLNFDFGDGQSQAMTGTVQQLLSGSNTLYAVSTFSHIYAAGGSLRYDAGFAGCCTLPDLENSNAGQNFDISALVNMGSTGSLRSPRSNSVPALYLALGSGLQFSFLTATGFDNEFLRYVVDPLGGLSPADIFSLSSIGTLGVDTSAPGLSSGLYDLRYRLESVNPITGQVSSSTSIYQLVNLVCTTGPSCSNPGVDPPNPMPEPGSLALVLLAMLGLGGTAAVRRRKRFTP
jgi:hypothetical protein